MTVNHHSMSDDIGNAKTVCQYRHEGLTTTLKQRREVAGVLGVSAILQVEMPFGLRKACAAAGGPFMNVKTENPGRTGYITMREPGDVRHNQSAIFPWIEGDKAGGALAGFPANSSQCRRASKITVQNDITSPHVMEERCQMIPPL